jgi:phage terminase large subunit-like protein
MRAMAKEAQEVPARENVFRQLYLNQWTDSATRWISTEVWEACGQDSIDPAELKGRECYAGLDLAYRDDFAALVLVFPCDEGSFALLPFFWIPEEGKRDLRTPPLAGWIKQELVNVSPGSSTDFGAIRTRINELGQDFQIKSIAVDPWNARQLSSELIEDGFEVNEFRQNMLNFNEPTKQFEVLAKARKLRHSNHPVLRWMMSNVVVEHDSSGNYRPSKKKSSEKIDGIVACIMGLAMAIGDTTNSASMYEEPGQLAI